MNKMTGILLLIATFLFYKLSYAAPMCRVMVHNSQATAYAPEITVVISTDRKNSNTMVVSKELLKHLAQNPNARINVHLNVAKYATTAVGKGSLESIKGRSCTPAASRNAN